MRSICACLSWKKRAFRAEIHTGAIQIKGRRYQDFEVFDSEGRLHRAGDSANPPLLIQTIQHAGWQPVELEAAVSPYPIQSSLKRFAAMILQGALHPLSGDSGLKDLEIVMATYESARLRARITCRCISRVIHWTS